MSSTPLLPNTAVPSDALDWMTEVSALADDAEPSGTSAAAVAAHNGATESVHGIDDTADLIVEGDSRLTDNRDPNPHSHASTDVTDFDAAAVAACAAGLEPDDIGTARVIVLESEDPVPVGTPSGTVIVRFEEP
jgi:hypothetical protein